MDNLNLLAMVAAENGKIERLREFIGRGLDVNASKDHGFYTPLHYALRHSRIDCMNYLYEQGCDIHYQPELCCYYSPLHEAVLHNQLLAAQWLIEKEHAIDPLDKNNNTPLMLCLLQDNPCIEIAEWLIENGASIVSRNNKGDTAYSIAEQKGLTELFDSFDI